MSPILFCYSWTCDILPSAMVIFTYFKEDFSSLDSFLYDDV